MDEKQRPTTAHRGVTSMNSDVSSSCGATSSDVPPPKKLPPIKAPVGLAKSPDLKNCKSKVGSLNNIKYTPAGGRVKIETQKLNWSAKSKVGSLDNKEHKPAGGTVKIESRKLEWKTSSKVQSLANINHKAGGGNVKIFNDSYRPDSSGAANTKSKSRPLSSASESPTTTDSNNVANPITNGVKNIKI